MAFVIKSETKGSPRALFATRGAVELHDWSSSFQDAFIFRDKSRALFALSEYEKRYPARGTFTRSVLETG